MTGLPGYFFDSIISCSCLENPRDGGAWWAAVYGVAQSHTRLKRLSSSSSSFSESLIDIVPLGFSNFIAVEFPLLLAVFRNLLVYFQKSPGSVPLILYLFI